MLRKLDPFIVGLIIAILAAYLFPEASTNKAIPLSGITSIGISLIFFFYGLKLSPREMKAGLSNWKLHIAVQATTFIIFPLIIASFHPLIKGSNNLTLWLAVMFLAALPSTVSSSVVMVSIAKGNVPAAIFNASISGLIGIFITPLWMGIFNSQADGDINFWTNLAQLSLRILAPVVAGLLLHRFWGNWANKNKKKLAWFDKAIILTIVFHSFGKSFSLNIFSNFNLKTIGLLLLAVLFLFILIYLFSSLSARLLGFNKADTTTLLFCGSKKSLVHGTVFSKVLFAHSASAGVFLVPIMIYHALQLIIISFIAQRKGNS